MKIKNVITVVALLAVLLSLITLFSCSKDDAWKYNEQWIKGKTYEEIIERYGEFDYIQNPGRVAGYRTKEAEKGFFGTSPEEFYMIYFDSEGYAVGTRHPAYRPGG